MIRFEIPGDPRGKGRPRFARRGAHVQTYTDDKTAAYENLVALAARAALGVGQPFAGPVRVSVEAYLRVPLSVSNRLRARMLQNDVKPVKLPDLDNIVKAVLDGCNQVLFHDDKQVVGLIATKTYGATPRVIVSVSAFGVSE